MVIYMNLHNSVLFVSQVLDYGVFLKLDTAVGFIEHLAKVLKVFALLETAGMKKSPYPPAVALYMATLVPHRELNTEIWTMLRNHLSCFNEECGEMSFSCLGRATAKDSLKHCLEHASVLYRLITAARLVAGDFKEEVGHLYKSSERVFIPVNSAEVDVTTTTCTDIVNSLVSDTFEIYTSTNCRRTESQENAVYPEDEDVTTLWIADSRLILLRYLARAQTQVVSHWLDVYSDHWPECLVYPEVESSDDEQVFLHDNRRSVRRRREVDFGAFVR